MQLLRVENLSVTYHSSSGPLSIVERLSLKMDEGEILGVIGESGSGKSVFALSIMGLLSTKMVMRADYLNLDGEDLMKMSAMDRAVYVASKAAIIFQEPQASLNPCFTVSSQLDETLSIHQGGTRKNRRVRALELLDSVGITKPEILLKLYPHQLSGGMNQRVAIAMALACKPRLLIADEPTTALDVTIQAQILELLVNLSQSEKAGLMLITHDFALLSENTDRIGVIYSGQLMEHAATENILNSPRHPYTRALLDSVPQLGDRHVKGSRLFALQGQIPAMDQLPVGCRLGPRCPKAEKQCVNKPELLSVENHGKVRCHLAKPSPTVKKPLEQEEQ
ncbi:ABC transporter ATP-binding protein [Aliikangiella coralliicola]|uniref:ABC-type dipeptide transporter n=1 Tax=Aliikangiella coralliicola TaxID=2592383 RepID=A0A545UAX8_9GAMM|nr:ABC transporter ATP-binding protein [Aliikangiella coralliicola]TQV86615.1 ABC transporter ATP-binding protein [Aliikangiella coralliicola]